MPLVRCHLWTAGLTLILLLFQPVAFAATFSTPALHGTAIGEGIQYLEDPSGQLSLEEVRHGTHHWQVNTAHVFNQGYSPSAWWLHFRLSNSQPETDWLLEVAYAVLDHLEVHVIFENGAMQTFIMGDKLPFPERPVLHRHFLVPLNLAQHEQVEIYLRVLTTSSVQVPLTLWDPGSFDVRDIGHTAAEGIYFGGIIIIALYNLLLYLALGDRTYLYYVANVISMLMFIACLHGWAFQFLWPHATEWNDTSILFFLSTLLIFAWAFTARFLSVVKISPLFARTYYAALALSCVMLVIALLVPYNLAIRIIIPFASFSCIWGMVNGVASWRKGNHSARYYILAWSMLLVGGVILALNKYQILPRNLVTDYATQIGSLLEVLLLSFALAERINSERAMRLHAQQEALDVQRQANEALEQRVQERTLALEDANRKLQELSDTDQLTGLKNRRYLNQFLDQEFARAARYKHNLAVLMIDVDHFKSVNDSYGHLTGDDCLQETAARIRTQMRWPSDLAARFGGEEFCVVLPETTLEGAAKVAERIRASLEGTPMSTRTGKLSLTISIGVAVGVPSPGSDVAAFAARADAALYAAKEQGRNRVVSHVVHAA